MLKRELSREKPPVAEGRQDGEPLSVAGGEGGKAALVESRVSALAVDRQRAVRAHLAGFDVREIMRMHGWPYQKARNLIARGMAELRAALHERGIHG